MTAPLVSFVIPSYNGEHFLGETLRSIEAQTLTDWEAIVVDDGSSDNTRAMVRGWPDPRVRLVERAQNGGPVVARNAGVAEARGRYIAGLDQDDLCRPERSPISSAIATSCCSVPKPNSCATAGCRRCPIRRTARPT
jgi:glycosyltransferase involved in cell wall biosynthesis